MEVPPQLELPWQLFKALYVKDPEAANLFYLAEVLPRELRLLKEAFQREHPGAPQYASSIHTLGQSVEAPVIAAWLLGVQAMHLLATERTLPGVETIKQLLPEVRVSHSLVPAEDLDAVAKAAEEAAQRLPGPLALDMTGGTKVMAAGMTLAAERLGAALYYVASRSKSEFRRPLPGSERLVLVRNSVK